MPQPTRTTHPSGRSVSQMKALKRHRVQSEPAEGGGHWDSVIVLRSLPPGPHAPAKAEARLLRRLCAQTGLTEVQVREHRKYRALLAEAAKTSQGLGGKSADHRYVLQLRRRIERRLGLPRWDPQVQAGCLCGGMGTDGALAACIRSLVPTAHDRRGRLGAVAADEVSRH